MGASDMSSPTRIAICAGSFDVLTNGHVDIITRAAKLFDRVVVAVLVNTAKQTWFSPAERVEMIQEALTGVENVAVDKFNGLLTDYVKGVGAVAVIRGLRSTSEFNDEWQMALMNRHLFAGCETVFLTPSPQVAYISSRLVKEIATLGGPLAGLVPSNVAARLAARRSPVRSLEA